MYSQYWVIAVSLVYVCVSEDDIVCDANPHRVANAVS